MLPTGHVSLGRLRWPACLQSDTPARCYPPDMPPLRQCPSHLQCIMISSAPRHVSCVDWCVYIGMFLPTLTLCESEKGAVINSPTHQTRKYRPSQLSNDGIFSLCSPTTFFYLENGRNRRNPDFGPQNDPKQISDFGYFHTNVSHVTSLVS